MKRFLISAVLVFVCIFLSGAALASQKGQIPKQKGFVNDFADILYSKDERNFEESLNYLWKETGVRVLVVTMPVQSIGDENLGEYVRRLYEEWYIGIGKEKEEGVIVFIRIKKSIKKSKNWIEWRTHVIVRRDESVGVLPSQICRGLSNKLHKSIKASFDDRYVTKRNEDYFRYGISPVLRDLASAIRKVHAEAEKRQAKVRKEQFVKKHGVVEWPSPETLLVNPFIYEGKTIGISAEFCEMTSATQAIFKLRSAETGPFAVYSKPIIVSGIPKGLFTKEEVVELAGKMLGKKDGRTHLKFVGAYFYKD